jgi:hypothetical protein
MTKAQPWMIFQPEGAHVFYMWNGKFPILTQIDLTAYNNEDWYWTGIAAQALPKKEIELLNKVAASKRKQSFTVPGRDHKFKVVSRGVFEKEAV